MNRLQQAKTIVYCSHPYFTSTMSCMRYVKNHIFANSAKKRVRGRQFLEGKTRSIRNISKFDISTYHTLRYEIYRSSIFRHMKKIDTIYIELRFLCIKIFDTTCIEVRYFRYIKIFDIIRHISNFDISTYQMFRYRIQTLLMNVMHTLMKVAAS